MLAPALTGARRPTWLRDRHLPVPQPGAGGQAGVITTFSAELAAAFLKTSYASSIWPKVNVCVPIFSAGIRPLATIFSRVGIDGAAD